MKFWKVLIVAGIFLVSAGLYGCGDMDETPVWDELEEIEQPEEPEDLEDIEW